MFSEYIQPVTTSISVAPISLYTCPPPVCFHHLHRTVQPPSPSMSPWSLYLLPPTIDYSTAKVSGTCHRQKHIYPPHWRSRSLIRTAKQPRQGNLLRVGNRTLYQPGVFSPGWTKTGVSHDRSFIIGSNQVFELWSYCDMIHIWIVQL